MNQRIFLSFVMSLCLGFLFSAKSQSIGTNNHKNLNEPGMNVDEGKLRYQTPPIDKNVPPVPMPDPTKQVNIPPGFKNQVIIYDTRTGKERIEDLPKGSGALSGFVSGRALRNQVGEPESFNNGLTRIYTTNYPWSAQCKIYMTIKNVRYQGSATLIDMKCAITAGHCVHGGKNSSWATNVVVHPRWDGDADQYGSANGIQLLTWTGWSNNSDFNHDMGAIRLDRPVGYLTGWLGYGYNTSNNFYKTTTFNVAGYPAEGGYAGQPHALYYGYGTFDNVYTYRLYAKTNWPYRIGGMS